MKFKQQAVYALLTAILAGIVTYVTQAMWGWPNAACMEAKNPLTFISFATWACYFVAGCNINRAVGDTLTFFGVDCTIAVSVAVIIIVWFMMFPEKVKMNGAAVFIGTALFFALHAANAGVDGSIGKYCNIILTEMIYSVIGLVAGFLTIWFSQITAPLGKDKE